MLPGHGSPGRTLTRHPAGSRVRSVDKPTSSPICNPSAHTFFISLGQHVLLQFMYLVTKCEREKKQRARGGRQAEYIDSGVQNMCAPLLLSITMEGTKRKKRAHSMSSTGSNSAHRPAKKKKSSAQSKQKDGAAKRTGGRSVTIEEIPDEGDNTPTSANETSTSRDAQSQPSARRPARLTEEELEAKKGQLWSVHGQQGWTGSHQSCQPSFSATTMRMCMPCIGHQVCTRTRMDGW